MHSRVALLILFVTLVTGCTSLAAMPPPGVNFTGIWRMDPELSGDPATLPGITAAGSANPAGGKLLGQLQSQLLRIDQTGSKITIIYDGGARQSFDWSRFEYGRVKSGWDDNHFVIRRIGPGGHELIRRYILSDEGDSLTVVTVFNKTALTQFYELDKDATRKAFGKLPSEVSKDA